MTCLVRLVDRDSEDVNVRVKLYVHANMTLDTLQSCIRQHLSSDGDFTSRRAIGVFDHNVEVFYPLSFLLHSPERFSSPEDYFLVVYEDSTFMNDVRRHSYNDGDGDDEKEDTFSEEEDTQCESQYVSETSDEDVPPSAPLCSSPFIDSTILAGVPVEFIDAHLKMLLDEVAMRTTLKRHSISQVFDAVAQFADTTGCVTEEGFLAGLGSLCKNDGKSEEGCSTFERIFNAIREFTVSEELSLIHI